MGSQGSAHPAQPAFFFVGGCGLILLMMTLLVRKTREIGK
jgi:hypothetical protein